MFPSERHLLLRVLSFFLSRSVYCQRFRTGEPDIAALSFLNVQLVRETDFVLALFCCWSRVHFFFLSVGNTDGRVGGKQYFHCPAKHGKVVKLSDVHAIMNPRVGISSTYLYTGKVSSRSLMSTDFNSLGVRVLSESNLF